ncbi:MAG: Fur family transcriptional regulator [Bacteroidia bacterium]
MLEAVENILGSFLRERRLKLTPERLSILKQVYAMNGPFTADTLLENLRALGLGMSRATVYNTLDLLLECRLVDHHQFGRFGSYYQKSHGRRQADHLLCTNCGRIQEFCDPRLHPILQDAGNVLGQEVHHHQLHVHGACLQLQKTGQCPHLTSSSPKVSSTTPPLH